MAKGQTRDDNTENATWDDATHIAVLEICREEFEAQNTTAGCQNRRGYINLGKKFKERTGREYTRKQFKNHWDSLKREYYIWKTLKLNATGLGINALTGSIDATDAWFEEQNKGLCTNEHAEVPGASRQHDHAGSDGSSDPELEATFEPASLSQKRSGGAAGATSGQESKKTRSNTTDECMLWIANAYEQFVSQVRATGSGDNVDTERMEVHRLMQLVVTDGYPEGTDEHYYAAIMLHDKRVRDAFTGFRTAEGRASYLRRVWPFFQSRGGSTFS